MTPQQQPAGGPPPKKGAAGGLAAHLHHPGAIIAGGGALVVVLFALMRRSSSSTGDDTSGSTSTYDSSNTDLYNSIQPEIDALQAALQQLQNGQSTPGAPVTTPVTTLPGKPVTGGTPPKASPPPAKKPPVKLPPPTIITVKHGDTLSGIAAKYHISMSALRKLNPTYWSNPKYKSGNQIWAGDKVRVK